MRKLIRNKNYIKKSGTIKRSPKYNKLNVISVIGEVLKQQSKYLYNLFTQQDTSALISFLEKKCVLNKERFEITKL